MKLAFAFVLGAAFLLAACADFSPPPSRSKSQQTPTSNKLGIQTFSDVEGLRSGITAGDYVVRKWRQDETGWICSTEYKEFGDPEMALRSNIAFYLESESKDYVRTLKLVMNINNRQDAEAGKQGYLETVTNTFQMLKINEPKDLHASIVTFKPYAHDEEYFTVEFKPEKFPRVDTYKLVITSK